MTVAQCNGCGEVVVTATKLKDGDKQDCPFCNMSGKFEENKKGFFKGEGVLIYRNIKGE